MVTISLADFKEQNSIKYEHNSEIAFSMNRNKKYFLFLRKSLEAKCPQLIDKLSAWGMHCGSMDSCLKFSFLLENKWKVKLDTDAAKTGNLEANCLELYQELNQIF